MPKLNISNAQSSDMTNSITDVTVDSLEVDGVTDQDETTYSNTDWGQQWGYFNSIPDLKEAILMKATWLCGKGWEADAETKVILDHITGWGKDTFDEILFNMIVISRIGGDSYCEIIREDEKIINLKPLNPNYMKIVVGRDGRIKRYEQINKTQGSKNLVFQPEDIFHLSNNRLANQIHGISDIKAMEQIILADNENFVDMKKIMHRGARPMILWKLKTDDASKIAAFVRKIDTARNLGEDMFIPDDEQIVTHELVDIDLKAPFMAWRDELRNKFYRSVGMPQIIFGASGGTTESGGKMEYLCHETVFEKEQRFLEQQIWNQLNLRIDLIPPTSLLENLQTDAAKDGAAQQMNMQQSDMMAGAGK